MHKKRTHLQDVVLLECSQPTACHSEERLQGRDFRLNERLFDLMLRAAALPKRDIATKKYFNGKEFYQRAHSLYEKNPSLERIIDSFRRYATESGAPVPIRNIEVALHALEMHAASFSPQLCDKLREILSSKDLVDSGEDSPALAPFVKYLCFDENPAEPYFQLVEYGAKFGEDVAEEVARVARNKVRFLEGRVRDDSQKGEGQVATVLIDGVFKKVEEIGQSLMPAVIPSAITNIESFFDNKLYIFGEAMDARKHFQTYVSLIERANSISQEVARIVAEESPAHIKALGMRGVASRYLSVVEACLGKPPILRKKVIGDFFEAVEEALENNPLSEPQLRIFAPRTLRIYIGIVERLSLYKPPILDEVFRQFRLSAPQEPKRVIELREALVKTKKDLVTVLEGIGELSEEVEDNYRFLEDTMQSVPDVSVLGRWLECAKLMLLPVTQRPQRMSTFLRYRFKEVYGKKPLLDEFRLFPGALEGNGDTGRTDLLAPLYQGPAKYTAKADECNKDNSGQRHALKMLMLFLYKLSYSFHTTQVSSNPEVCREAVEALQEVGRKRGVHFSGIEMLRMTPPASGDGGIEDRVNSSKFFVNALGPNGATEFARFAKGDFSSVHSARSDYDYLREIPRIALEAGLEKEKALDTFIEKNGTGLLDDIIKLVHRQFGNTLSVFSTYLHDLRKKLCPAPVDELTVRMVPDPYKKMINKSDACVFETEDIAERRPDKGLKCSEASLSYAMDPNVHILMMETRGRTDRGDDETNDFVAAITIDILLQPLRETILLVDGVRPNREARYISTPDGRDWKDVMLESIVKFGLLWKLNRIAINVSHGKSETKTEYEFARYVAENVFNCVYGKDIIFDEGLECLVPTAENIPGMSFFGSPGSPLFGIYEEMDMQKEHLPHIPLFGDKDSHPPKEWLEAHDISHGFYHSWYRVNRGSDEPYWNTGEGKVRVLLINDLIRFALKRGWSIYPVDKGEPREDIY